MRFKNFPYVDEGLRLISYDNGMSYDSDTEVPVAWRPTVLKAEDELRILSKEELETLTTGEQADQKPIAARCPNANLLFAEAFDGELCDVVYKI